MSSPVCPESWNKVSFGSSVCDVLTELVKTNDKLKMFFGWMFDANCKISQDFVREFLEMFSPIGSGFWTPLRLPEKLIDNSSDLGIDPEVYVEADGRKLPKAGIYAKLYSIVGDTFAPTPDNPAPPGFDPADDFLMPDLRGRFMLHYGTREVAPVPVTVPPTPPIPIPPNYTIGQRGGEDTSTAVVDLMKNHTHPFGILQIEKNTEAVWPSGADFSDAGALSKVSPAIDTEEWAGLCYDAAYKDTIEVAATKLKKASFMTLKSQGVPTTPIGTNMPPFFTGIYYMRANHKFNGVLL